MENNNPIDILEALKSANSPICCIDSRLDFDAFCSALAFRNFCSSIGKDLRLTYTSRDLPDRFKKLLTEITNEYYEIEFNLDPADIDFSKHDLLIYLDSGNDYHISNLKGNFEVPHKIMSINIDHHSGNPFYGRLNYIRNYPSTCSVLFELFKYWNFSIDKTTAKLLLLGHYTDSMFFQTDSMSSSEFIKVAELVDLSGVNISEYARTLKVDSEEDVKVKQIVYKNLNIKWTEKYAYSYGMIADYDNYDLDKDAKTVGPSDLLKYIKGMEFVFYIKEEKRAMLFNVSLRSVKSEFSVADIAIKLGGGGHKMAASCQVRANNIDQVVAVIIETSEQIQLESNHE